MNIYKFHRTLKEANNGKVNIITKTNAGYVMLSINGRTEQTEVINKNTVKYFESIDNLTRHSNLYAQNKSNSTVIVIPKGTDCTNWKTSRIS